MDIKTAISKCLNNLSLAKTTTYGYGVGLKSFVIFLGTREIKATDPIEKLNIQHFIDFIMWLFGKYKKGTASYYATASKAFLEFLVVEGIVFMDYLDGIRYKMAFDHAHRKREEKLPRFPKKGDIQRMLEAVYTHQDFTPKRERDIALLEMLASTGCRISELIALDVKDIDLENRTAIVIGKGDKERHVFFNSQAKLALENYWAARRSSRMPTDPIFARHDKGAGNKRLKRMTTTTARNIVNEIAEFAGLDVSKMSPHYFRHAFAIRVLSETGNLALAQDLLGHRDPKSTRIYAKIYADDLKQAHRSIFG
jgi:site-specific recombinase XerD